MASPGHDAPALDSRPHDPVLGDDRAPADSERKMDINGLVDPVEPALERKPHLEQLPTLSNILSKPESPLPHSPPPPADKPRVNGGDSNGIHGINDGSGPETDTFASAPALASVSGNAPIDTTPALVDTAPTAPSPRVPSPPATLAQPASPQLPTPREASPMAPTKEEAVSSEVAAASAEAPRAPTPVKEPNELEQSMESPQDVSMVEEPKDTQETKDTEMSDAPDKAVESGAEGNAAEEVLPSAEVELQPASMSQLDIESRDPLSAEVSMTDVSSTKVAREREEDGNDVEPATKRAKTEPEEETAPTEEVIVAESAPVTSAPVDADAPVLDETTLPKLPQWEDSERTSAELTTYQRREMRKILNRIKKNKAGANFRDSVQKLWPGIWDSYVSKVDNPVDLAKLDQRLRESFYTTLGQFQADLALIFKNALLFNGPGHDITVAAAATVKQVWEEVLPIPTEEPPRQKPPPKTKPVRESRIAAEAAAGASRRQSGAVAPNSTGDGTAVKAATKDQGDRRSSTATEGERPKRTVRAPKPKDIDYTTKPSRKKLKPELQFAEEVLTEVMSPKHSHLNGWFLDPVDAEGLNIPDYYSIIKKPMHLNKVSQMLNAGEFASLKDFEKTARLVFDNCFTFNGPVDQGNPVSQLAKQLEDVFNAQMKGKDAWLARYAKANAPAFNDSDDEEDEDDDDYGEDGGEVADTKEIEELQAKLDEETRKLNSMLISGNQSMIDIQKGLVDMVQKALIKAAQAAQSKPKSDKPKKAGRGGKAKGAGGRKSTGGGPGKKAGGPKKAGVKKSLTAADKDQIANAINDLEYPHLDKAIDIIKRDTGQNENNDGELELDIDQLSTDALLKLWELCKKALPSFARDVANAAAEKSAAKAAARQANAGAKPKKNKPMNAEEQEARIAQLTALHHQYKYGQDPGDAGRAAAESMNISPGAESSDDSDSEEE